MDVGDGELILRDVGDAEVGLNVGDVVAVVGLEVGNFEVGIEEGGADVGLAVGSLVGTLVAGLSMRHTLPFSEIRTWA